MGVKEFRYSKFRDLAEVLAEGADKTFLHRWQDRSYASSLPPSWAKQLPAGWDHPGQSGETEAPKYLYRGESDVYPSSVSSRGRLNSSGRFTPNELELLDKLTYMASEVWNLRVLDRFRSVGWPQHYGFPTSMLDLSIDPMVALHFAAWTEGARASKTRVVYRVDLEAIEHKIYAPAGGYSPLAAASIMDVDCTRATRQRAWMICSRDEAPLDFDFQNSEHLLPHMEKFAVDATDADSFVQPKLLDAQDDGFAAWPLAIVRGLKVETEGPLPRNVVEWLCNRMPLFEWTPVQAMYDGLGRGTRLQLLSPADAAMRDGRDYHADRQAVIEELTSPEMSTPNGIVFALRTGGKPGASEWLEPGQEYEFQWRYPFPGEGRWGLPGVFERLRL
jgi:hypothetical protein